jgi:hypothetical protein
LLVPLALPATAHAQEGDCPPGSWFCEEVDLEPPPLDEDDDADEAAPPPRAEPARTRRPKPARSSASVKRRPATPAEAAPVTTVDGSAPVVIVKEPGAPDPQVVVIERRAAEPEPALEPPPPPPPKKQRRWRETFGLNLRLQGAGFGAADESLAEETGMGGIGLSFRWRPSPYFAFDFGGDVMGGTDYYGFDRVETTLSGSGLLYFNPQHRVQVYGIGGLHATHAEVEGFRDGDLDGWTWMHDETVGRDYVGGHAGIGVEFRVSRLVGLHMDLIGIVRERVGDGPPEFVNADGRTTDTSGAGLFRAGINFWW